MTSLFKPHFNGVSKATAVITSSSSSESAWTWRCHQSHVLRSWWCWWWLWCCLMILMMPVFAIGFWWLLVTDLHPYIDLITFLQFQCFCRGVFCFFGLKELLSFAVIYAFFVFFLFVTDCLYHTLVRFFPKGTIRDSLTYIYPKIIIVICSVFPAKGSNEIPQRYLTYNMLLITQNEQQQKKTKIHSKKIFYKYDAKLFSMLNFYKYDDQRSQICFFIHLPFLLKFDFLPFIDLWFNIFELWNFFFRTLTAFS